MGGERCDQRYCKDFQHIPFEKVVLRVLMYIFKEKKTSRLTLGKAHAGILRETRSKYTSQRETKVMRNETHEIREIMEDERYQRQTITNTNTHEVQGDRDSW